MNLGLGNLTELKAQLLPATMRTDEDYDDLIAAIGQGVAAQFDKFTNRRLARTVGAVDIFSADRDHWYLQNAPVESITSIEQKDDHAEGFITLTDALQNSDLTIGYLFFGSQMGSYHSRVRVTYTGGWWFDTTEDESGEMPEGATALPADLKLAWFLQCRHVWDSIDVLSAGIAAEPKKYSALHINSAVGLELVPDVRQKLLGHTRYQMT
jgi:hypothetical protein